MKSYFLFAKRPNKPKDSARKLIFACLLEICVFAHELGFRLQLSLKNELILCIFEKNKNAAWCGARVARRPAAWFGVVQGWDGTYLPRPSHDDGTFTQGKLPQIIYYILYIIFYIL